MIPWTDMRMWLEDGRLTGEITFTHVDDRTGDVKHFAVDRINKHIAEHGAERIVAGIDLAFAATMPVRRGLEQHRLDRITVDDLIAYPIVLAYMPEENEHLIIDGSHRYFIAATLGWPSLPAWVVQPEVWEQYLIDLPPEIVEFSRQQIKEQDEGKPIQSHIR